MPSFDSEGVEIAYIDEGAGEPVLLIHGFASNITTNWTGPGWVKTLNEAGYRVIAFDNRGHGQSEKLYELEKYGAPLMAGDADTARTQWARIDDPNLSREVRAKARGVGMTVPAAPATTALAGRDESEDSQ